MLDAERLALSSRATRVGSLALKLQRCARIQHLGQRTDRIQDKTAIAYLGEVVPTSSSASLGITNALDLLQVSPTDTAVELTQATPAVPGAPDVYYESLSAYGKTFARVVPTSALEAKAQVQEMQALGVDQAVRRRRRQPVRRGDGLRGASTISPGGMSLASSQRRARTALFYGSASEAGAARFFAAAAAANPAAKLFGPSALDDPSFAAGAVARPCTACTSPRRASSRRT